MKGTTPFASKATTMNVAQKLLNRGTLSPSTSTVVWRYVYLRIRYCCDFIETASKNDDLEYATINLGQILGLLCCGESGKTVISH